MALDSLEEAYDYILIDCPPSTGPLVDNALLACRNVLVPAPARTTARRSLHLMLDQIDILEEAFGVEISLVALVANEVTADSEAEEVVAWLSDVVGESAVFEVRKRVALQRAWNNSVSIFAYPEVCDATVVYDDIAGRLESIDES